MKNPEGTTWLTTREVAELLRVNESTINRWSHEGRLHYHQPGGPNGNRFYDRAQLADIGFDVAGDKKWRTRRENELARDVASHASRCAGCGWTVDRFATRRAFKEHRQVCEQRSAS